MKLITPLAPYPDLNGSREPTARDYVQDGLVAMWDGIENAGWGEHTDTGNSWTDLIGGYSFAMTQSGRFTDDSVKMYSRDYNNIECSGFPDLEEFTIEFYVRNFDWAATRNKFSLYSSKFMKYVKGGVTCALVGKRQELPIYPDTSINGFSMSVAAGMLTRVRYDTAVASMSGQTDYDSGVYSGLRIFSNDAANSQLCNVRIYSRALTAAEVAANYAVDKKRFNLPDGPLSARNIPDTSNIVRLASAIPSGDSSISRRLFALSAIQWMDAKKAGPTAQDYVQDGLIALWDGIENAGWGVHDGSASAWTNLIDAGVDLVLSSTKASWGDDCLVCINGETDRTNAPCASVAKVYDSAVVLEAVVKLTSRWSGYNSAGAGFKTHQTIFRSGRTGTSAISRGYEITLPLIDGDASSFVGLCAGSEYYDVGTTSFAGRLGIRTTLSRFPRGSVGYIDGSPREAESSSRIAMPGANTLVGCISGEVCSLRIYSRALTAEEIAHNYEIDKQRFGLEG